jgi:hypothetical protein
VVADESDGNDDVNWMDDMVADIGRGYDLESEIHCWRCKISTGPSDLRRKSTRWHQCDHVAGRDPSYGIQIKVQLLELVLQ